jgi:hypothetical protein
VFLWSRSITGFDGFFDFAQECSDSRTARFVDSGAGFVLAGAFFCLGRICHGDLPSVRFDVFKMRDADPKRNERSSFHR